MTKFLHGAEVIELDGGSRPISTVASAVIGLVGTAPNAAPAVAATLTLGSAVLNDGLIFTAVNSGLSGNALSVTVLSGDTLAATVEGNNITVTLATGSTADQVGVVAQIQGTF